MTMLVLMLLGADAGAPAWPAHLTDDLVRVVVTKAGAKAVVSKGKDGVWRMESPHVGEGDPDALVRLSVALGQPQVVGVTPARGTPSTVLELTAKGGVVTRVTTFEVPLGQPVPVRIEGRGDFLLSPVELNKLPAPADFQPPGLWVSANGKATSLKVTGRVRYELTGQGEAWTSPDGRASPHDLDDVPGVITGRQAIGFPATTDPRQLGLTPPAATAKLCAGKICREFRFGVVTPDGGRARYYAQGPDADPLELRDNDWKLLVDGPFR